MLDEQTHFWAANQPGFRFTAAAPGTPEFFAAVEAHRYALESHIPEVVQFGAWSGRDVLEVGCGIATDGVRFARAGARYTGLDVTAAALDLARARFEIEGVEGTFVEGSATQLPFGDAAFDLVYSHGVIHHIADTEAAVAEFRRVLRPGGTVLVMVYHRNSFNYWFTILLVRRLLAGVLLVPGAARAVSRITGEREDVLEGHRTLLGRHGIRYLADTALFLSNNTDGPGNPLSKVYTREDVERWLAGFDEVETTVRFLNLRVYPGGGVIERSRLGRALGARIGWHLYVRGRKPSA